MSKILPVLAFGLPTLVTVLSLPLALGLVGPNEVYGYRTSRSLGSPAAWYAANSIAGWCGIVAAGVSLAAAYLIVRYSSLAMERRYTVSIICFVAIMMLCGLIQYSLNR
jgi:uncharacterized membrane protein